MRKKSEESLFEGYSVEKKPLREYAILMGVLHASVAAGILAVSRSRRGLPKRMNQTDLVVLSLASHKLARLIAKDKVTSPLRAPFTQFEGAAGSGEVNEVERGSGMRRTIGELITCPYCVSVWAAGALVLGHAMNPRATRVVSSILAITAVSHFLNQGYSKMKGD
ncbi:MAG: DUF1360 domain-containing protein [Opitutales bacterium]